MDPKAHVYGRLTSELAGLLAPAGLAVQPVVQRDPYGIPGLREFELIFRRWAAPPPAAVVVFYSRDGLDQRIEQLLPADARRIAVFRESAAPPPGWARIDPDTGLGMRIIAQHLVDLGHQRVGIVTNQRPARVAPDAPRNRKSAYGHTRQILGLGNALRNAGLAHPLTIHYNDNRFDPADREEIDRIAAWLDGPDRPTAVVSSDFRLIGVRRAAEKLGLRVPEDLALIGIGDTPWAQALDLTSLALREELAARHVARMLTADAWQFEGASQHVHVEPRLIIRRSCGGDAKADQRHVELAGAVDAANGDFFAGA